MMAMMMLRTEVDRSCRRVLRRNGEICSSLPPSIWDQTVTNEPKIKNKNLVKFLNYDGQGGTGNVNHYTQILNGTSLEYLVLKNITG